MSTEGRDFSQVEENNDDNNLKLAKDLPEISSYGSHLKDNGFYHDDLCLGNTHDDFVQMIVELKFQNEYLKSQFRGLQIHCLESSKSYQQNQEAGAEGVESENVKELHDKIDSLSNDLLVEKQTRIAAEEALKHLRTVFSEADGKAQEFSVKLTEAQQKMKQEIKERDDKYAELDSKFSRLHKRAKQRIQEVQKEKDDIEAQLSDMNERAERTSSQLVALQQELERTRQQANEALKTMDMERQQLRSANNKLRDNVEELRHALEPKDHALENLQHLLSEKEQMLEDMRSQLQSADEKGHAALAELSAKHQKQVDSLEGELADAVLDRNKAADTISSLQVMVAEKESRIAEMDAALSGEAARLKAAVETVKGELAHQRHEHEKEKESWDAAHQVLKTKLEMAENNRIRAEVEAAKTRSQMELEFSMQNQLLNARDAELASLKEEISHLEAEFSSYKIRAHSLLQKKDAELVSAKDSEQVKALEEALKEAEKEILLMSAEKDQILKELKEAVVNHERVLAARDEVLGSVEQKIKGLETRVDSDRIRHQLEKESWELNLRNVEETWRLKCEALKAQNEESMGPNLHLQKEMEEFKLRYRKLKEEHDSFRDLADTMIEEKDKEISKLIDDNKKLQRSLELRAPVERNDDYSTVSSAFQRQEFSSTSAAEHQILILARQQAQREEELAQSQRHILALQEEIEELERENRLHNEQVSMLKEEFRNSERSRKREGVDMTYLKNVILKLLETGEVEALLPVVAMLLQFSPEEIQKCQQAYQNQAYQNSSNAPPSPAGDGSNKSLFSRFSFS